MMDNHDKSLPFTDYASEVTQPLPNLGALTFQLFLAKHGLTILDVALAAQVCLLVVWKITCGKPIKPVQAQQIRNALLRFTPSGYRGQILVDQGTFPA